MLDGSDDNPLSRFNRINEELRLFNSGLADRPQVVAFNKMDLPQARDQWPSVQEAIQSQDLPIYPISAATGEGVQVLMRQVGQMVRSLPQPSPTAAEVPVFRLEDTPTFTVEREGDGWRVRGQHVEQLAARTMWQYHDAVERVQRQMEAMGLQDSLRQAGVQLGDTVRIGDTELEWMW
jgi:GTP-binding protein